MSSYTNNNLLQKKTFNISINAPKQKVWNILWDDKNYRDWTSVFSEGSHAKTDWEEGSAIQFLDGKNAGMGSIISKKIMNEEMIFTHLTEIKDGIEQPINEKTTFWSGATEAYTLKEQDCKTELTIVMDTADSMADYFADTFPKALAKVKALAEQKITITIHAIIKAPVKDVWHKWTTPAHIVKWNNASEDWHTTHSENDPKVGGRFLSRMEAKDGSMAFDFGGRHTSIIALEQINSVLDDGREMCVTFTDHDGGTTVTECFDAEDSNPVEMQRAGWQSILNNFKHYVENK